MQGPASGDEKCAVIMKPIPLHYAFIEKVDAGGARLGVLTIRNVDDDVIAALKRQAKANHRSLEGELRHLLARHALPQPTLGVVRERARMAAGYEATRTVPDTASDEADVQPGHGEWLGAMSDVGEIVGDIVSPAVDPSEWTALRSEAADPGDGRTR